MPAPELSASNPRSVLLHGPGAESAAAEVAARHVVVLGVRCEGGLRAEAAREVAAALEVVPPGSAAGVVVVGPMDGSTPRAMDALLKEAEELRGATSLLLWAADEAAVSATLRSRCLRVYCAGGPGADPNAQVAARGVVEALEARQPWRLVELVRGIDGRDLALAAAEIAAAGDPGALLLWARLRVLAAEDRPAGRPRVLAALLGDA